MAVDGAEIRRSPVEVGSLYRLYRYLQGFIHPGWLFGISEPSTVSFNTDESFVVTDGHSWQLAERRSLSTFIT